MPPFCIEESKKEGDREDNPGAIPSVGNGSGEKKGGENCHPGRLSHYIDPDEWYTYGVSKLW